MGSVMSTRLSNILLYSLNGLHQAFWVLFCTLMEGGCSPHKRKVSCLDYALSGLALQPSCPTGTPIICCSHNAGGVISVTPAELNIPAVSKADKDTALLLPCRGWVIHTLKCLRSTFLMPQIIKPPGKRQHQPINTR